MPEAREFNAARITFDGDGVAGPEVVAAVAWDGEDGTEWDLVAAVPAVEPILKGHFSWPAARSRDEIRRFVERGHKGYRMERPTKTRGTTPGQAARTALVARER